MAQGPLDDLFEKALTFVVTRVRDYPQDATLWRGVERIVIELRDNAARQVEDAYRLDLDEDDMSAMRAKWAKATGVAGDPQDAMKLDLKLQVTRFLQKKGTLPDEVDDRDDTTVETLKRFEEAVIRQVNQTPGASGALGH